MKESYSIYNVLEAIRKRPGMYVGEIDLNYINSFIWGYEMAMDDAGVEDVSRPEFRKFHEFVRAKYNYYESTAGWANMIKAVVLGLNPETVCWEGYDSEMTIEQQKQALSKFYELLDEFKSMVPDARG